MARTYSASVGTFRSLALMLLASLIRSAGFSDFSLSLISPTLMVSGSLL